MTAPTTFRAGDSVSWEADLPAYPASAGWALKYRMLWAGGAAVAISTAAAGDLHAVSLAASATTDWTAGAATLLSWVEKGAERVTLDQQAVAILPNLQAAETFDGRSQAVKGLADAEAALAAYVAGGKVHVAEYDIAGRRMKFRTATEITDLIAHYKREVANERALAALLHGGTPGRVHVRF
ncbi:MAG: hypothetical protein KKF85_03440 [Gammaproteobacteria bacterium]|nr:hypothetical protein [Rhodocyclaceae bacterium]MBU3908877.1 hypothetical protein [Gammaproteobacteria bacterium]MBU3987744.1 hypothetical protein [Gammaproteobacteria bacterium]MBU4003355.1 hypothetical protein [Gammaproteobacteria bacterium]MBU4021826.1 hypothetical protein [Gammaproteobacteria bacterium]